MSNKPLDHIAFDLQNSFAAAQNAVREQLQARKTEIKTSWLNPGEGVEVTIPGLRAVKYEKTDNWWIQVPGKGFRSIGELCPGELINALCALHNSKK